MPSRVNASVILKIKSKHLMSMTFLLVLLFSSSLFTCKAIETTSYNSKVKNMDFYFHFLDIPENVGGVETKYVMNTIREFRYLTNYQAFSGSLYKPIGLPKISVIMYLSPGILAPVTLNGEWKVSLWVNSTAYKPVTFNVQYKEISKTGAILWDSSQLSPIITSAIDEHLDTSVLDYVLSSTINHTLESGSTLQVLVDVNAGSSSAIRVWFDSPLYPSKVTLPATDYARPTKAALYSYDGSKTDLFDFNWTQEKRKIRFEVEVMDPFGKYDVNKVTMLVFYNKTKAISDVIRMESLDNPSIYTLSRIYTAEWSYPNNIQVGDYSVVFSVRDNNGAYKETSAGNPEPFIETLTHEFQIGPVTYYDPQFKVVDDVGSPLPEAQVYFTWPNGVRDDLPRYTGTIGNVTLRKVLPGEYGVTTVWKDKFVNQTSIKVHSDGIYVIRAQVYELRVNVVDNAAKGLSGAYVLVYSSNGLGYGFDLTNAQGLAVMKLPKGSYNLAIHYKDVFWLTQIAEIVEKKSVEVNSSKTIAITIDKFPPPIWQTTGFVLLAITIIISVGLASVIILRRRRKERTLT